MICQLWSLQNASLDGRNHLLLLHFVHYHHHPSSAWQMCGGEGEVVTMTLCLSLRFVTLCGSAIETIDPRTSTAITTAPHLPETTLEIFTNC